MRDLLVLGTIHTLDPERPRAEAALVRAARFAAVGGRAECEAAAGAGAERVELGAGCATPGFVDAHGHPVLLGRMRLDVDLSGAASEADCVARVAARARATPPGTWIRGRGWDQSRWPGGAWPDRRSLDAAVPHHPVVLDRVDVHSAWVNGAALAAAGIGPATPDPPGGRIHRDAAGAPTGLLVDGAHNLVLDALPATTDGELEEALALGLAELARLGLTEVHDASVNARLLAAYRRLAARDALPLRVFALLDGQAPPGELDARLAARGPAEQGLLTVRGVKLFLDGALGSRGAALVEPYADEPQTRGLLLLDPEALRDRLRRISRAGLQPAVHAIGDAACGALLRAFVELKGELAGLRPRAEHLQILHPDDLPLLAASGAVASMQPVHAISDGAWVEDRIGLGRARLAYAWRSVLDAGMPLAFGSDHPVESADPRLGLEAAERRVPRGRGEAWNPGQRLTRREAVAAFTAGAAFAGFAERRRGRVRAGLDADLTLWGEDLLAAPVERLREVPIRGTVVAGRLAPT